MPAWASPAASSPSRWDNSFRGAIDHRLGHAERPAHVAHGRPPAVADDVGHHGGTVAAIPAVDMLDYFLAAPVHDVEIDVGRLAALAREKPLEQQHHPRGIDGRDPQAVADYRVGRRAAPLAEDAVLAAVLNNLAHRQEIAAVVEFLDQRQFPVDLLADGLWNAARKPRARTVERELAEPAGRGKAVGQPLSRIAIADLGQRERAALRHLAGSRDERRLVGEQPRHLRRRLQIVLGVRLEPAAGGRQRNAVADTGDHILHVAARRLVVQHFGGGHQRQAGAGRAGAQPRFLALFLRPPVTADQGVQAIAKRLPHLCDNRRRRCAVDQQAAVATPQRDQPSRMPAQLRPGDARFTLRPPQPAGSDQAAEVGVPLPVRRQQDTRGQGGIRVGPGSGGRRIGDGSSITYGHLGTDDEAQTQLPRLPMRAHHAVDAVAVGQRQRRQTAGMRLLHQLLGMAGALEKREVALAPERNVLAGHRAARCYSTCPCQSQRRRGWS